MSDDQPTIDPTAQGTPGESGQGGAGGAGGAGGQGSEPGGAGGAGGRGGDSVLWGGNETTRTPAEVVNTERKRGRILITVGALFGITTLLTLTFAGLNFLRLYGAQRALWDPLGDYPEQQATPEVHVLPEATSAEIDVVATKCTKKAVAVYGTSTWVSLDPPGAQVIVATAAVAAREKGCVTRTYHNLIPEEVLTRTKQYGGNVVWRLTGVEVPVEGQRTGVPVQWQTTPVRIEIVDTDGQPVTPHR